MNTSLAVSLENFLKIYHEKINTQLEEFVLRLGPQTSLRDACQYALLTPGKRFRPAIVWMIAKALNPHFAPSETLLSVELFHAASLIADDLPCMDNEELRRNQPTVHRKFDEATALLASFALIAAGYELLVRQTPAAIGALLVKYASKTTGIFGASGGQFLDLFPPIWSLETIQEMIHKKTVALFELSFVMGWLLGGGEPSKLLHVEQLASHFGMAFQLLDDLEDQVQDRERPNQPNFVLLFGEKATQARLAQEVEGFERLLKELGLEKSDLALLVRFLRK